MRLSVKVKVVLGSAGVLLVGLLSMLVIYGALRTARKAMHEVADVEEPTSAAAYEMEINVIGTGLGVLKYLDTGDPQYRDRVEKDEADFHRFKVRYDQLAETAAGKELGNKVGVLFGEFVQLGRVLMDQRDERETLFRAIAENFEVIDGILDEEIQENLGAAGLDGREKVLEAAAMEGDIAEAGAWLGNYLRVPTPAYRERIFDNARDFRVHLAEFKNLRLSETERQRTERLEKIFSRTFSMIQKDLALHDELQEQVRRFLALREQMDYVLDEEIQTLTMKDLVASKQMAEEAHVNVIWSISLLLPVFLLLGLGTARVLIRDYTQRKRPEEELKESEERFRSVTQSASEAIIIADSKGEIISWNDGAQITFGYVEQEVLGKALTVLMPERYREAHRKGLERVGSTGEIHIIGKAMELFGLRKDSSEFPLEISLSSWETKKGRFYAGIARDVTARKRAEDVLQHHTEELKRSNADLEQFASAASHDLQEPLRTVSSFSQLLAKRYKGTLGKDADEFITYISEGACRMQALIQDLLAYSRLSTQGKPLKSVEVSKVVDHAVHNLRIAIEESQAKVSQDSLPVVHGDPAQLAQLFQNLIGNAIKFRDKKPPRIHIRAESNGQFCTLAVKDNGIGIDPKFGDRIFAIFQRLHTRDSYDGTGIGLALCKKIVERHRGRIWMESQPREGTTFYFTLPLEEK